MAIMRPTLGILPIVCSSSVFCYAVLCVHISFAIILKKTRNLLVVLLLLSYRCIVTIDVLWLFLAVPWFHLQYVIEVFPYHTYLLFKCLSMKENGCADVQSEWYV